MSDSKSVVLKLAPNNAVLRYNKFLDKVPSNNILEFNPFNGVYTLLEYSTSKNEGLIDTPLIIERRIITNKTFEQLELIISSSLETSNIKIEIKTPDSNQQITATSSAGKAIFGLDKTIRIDIPHLSSRSEATCKISCKDSEERIFDIFEAIASYKIDTAYSNLKVEYMNIRNEAPGEKFQKGIKYSTLCKNCVFRFS